MAALAVGGGRTCGRRSGCSGRRSQNANSALDALNASFPNTRAFAREILPGVKQTPATIDAAFAVDRAGAASCSGPDELGGLLDELQPGDARPRQGRRRDAAAAAAGRPASPSASTNVDPADRRREDRRRAVLDQRGELQGVLVRHGRPRRRGPELRRQRPRTSASSRGGGDQTLVDRQVGRHRRRPSSSANAIAPPLGTRPAYPGKRPPYKPDAPCYKQPLPDLNGAPRGRPTAAARRRVAGRVR